MIDEIESLIVRLEISSLVGVSFGAQHIYGKLSSMSNGYYQEIELERHYTVDDIERAAPGYSDEYRQREQRAIKRYIENGTKTGGFVTREDVCLCAIDTWRQHFPNAKMLLMCIGSSSSVAPMLPLDGATLEFVDVSQQVIDAERKLRRVGQYKEALKLYRSWESALIGVLGTRHEAQTAE